MWRQQPKGASIQPELEQNRMFFRIDLFQETTVQLWFHGHPVTPDGDCTILDISAGGAKLATTFAMPVSDQQLMVVLGVSLIDKHILTAQIVWEEVHEKDIRYLYGVRWIGLDNKTQEALLHELMTLQIQSRRRI